VESVGFFARAHDVDADRLLQELHAAMGGSAANTAPTEDSSEHRLADAIYRPFFKAGIVVVLTLGAVWGAYLLLRIGLNGSFTAVGLHEINAHGHAQIFGWVGLFVMGFAYQAFPRFKHTTLRHPRLAHASLWLMLAGLITRAVLEPLAGSVPALVPLAVAASALEVLAVGIFALVLFATWRGSGKPLAVYDYYITCALVWFVVQTLYDSVYLAATLMAADRQALLNLVAM
jgi:heme/copper-type cytochrome/quinol oxidase subunit 1